MLNTLIEFNNKTHRLLFNQVSLRLWKLQAGPNGHDD